MAHSHRQGTTAAPARACTRRSCWPCRFGRHGWTARAGSRLAERGCIEQTGTSSGSTYGWRHVLEGRQRGETEARERRSRGQYGRERVRLLEQGTARRSVRLRLRYDAQDSGCASPALFGSNLPFVWEQPRLLSCHVVRVPSPEATSTRDKRRHLALELISKKLPAATHIAHVDALPRLVNLR